MIAPADRTQPACPGLQGLTQNPLGPSVWALHLLARHAAAIFRATARPSTTGPALTGGQSLFARALAVCHGPYHAPAPALGNGVDREIRRPNRNLTPPPSVLPA